MTHEGVEPNLSVVWRGLRDAIVSTVDAIISSHRNIRVWSKPDRSHVSDLDFSIDLAIRAAFYDRLPLVPVLSEELGLLESRGGRSGLTALVDPIDGTESLLSGEMIWWVSVGLVSDGLPRAGLLYQPPTRRLHDSMQPHSSRSESFTVGLSPDLLAAPSAARFRDRLRDAGATLVATRHSAEKVASVIEGRCSAAVFLPSARSPHWNAWDLAGPLAVAASNRLVLARLDGSIIRLDRPHLASSAPWICAVDRNVWTTVSRCLETS